MSDKEKMKREAGLEHLPTDLTYELRMAVSGHRKHEFLSWGYQWEDKPHRLVYTACSKIEAQAAEIERLRAALRGAYEVYAGSDGFIPQTCAEGYQQQIIKQMVDCITAALTQEKPND